MQPAVAGGYGHRLMEWLETRLEAERDQLPLWFPVGLIAGIAAWFWLPDRSAWIVFGITAAALALAFFALASSQRFGRAFGLFALAALGGCLLVWWKADQAAAPRLERQQMLEFAAHIESVQPMAAEARQRLVVRPQGEGLPDRIRLNLDDDKATPGIEPGAGVLIRAWLLPPPAMAAPGGYDFSRTAWFQRIGATGRILDIRLDSPSTQPGWRARIADWRRRLAAHIRVQLPGSEGGVAAALATGDQFGIPEIDLEAMRRSGLAHLLSVSGLHLTAVVGAVMLVTLKLLALSPTLALRFRLVLIAAAVAGVAGIAYTLLTGAEVPTIRACIAALLVLAGIALGREALTLRLLAVGALAVLLLWPESLVGPSFQLSFAAITAIVALHEHPSVQALLSRRDEGWFAYIGRLLLGLLLTGLAVELALAPIALFHFHQSGLYGALANIVAIPLTTFLIMPIEAIALVLDLAGAGAPAWWLAGRLLSAVLSLAHVAAAAPGAVTMVPAIPRGAFALIVVGGLWICLWRTRWRRLGLLPILIGSAWALSTPTPDILITGDGRHVALRTEQGQLALLRPRAGDYVRDTLAELAGAEPEWLEMDRLAIARCNRDLCAANIDRDGRRWRLLATRSPHFVRWPQMVRACAEADIVVSDRRLPRGCQPRWLKADREWLGRSGGLVIVLASPPRVDTVAGQIGRHPWSTLRP
ncbi:MAG: ComEC/Rec2 family competence protein [Sphingosinicella sp.]